MLTLWQIALLMQVVPMIDLTVPPTYAVSMRKLPVMHSVGGIAFHHTPPPPKLPLAIRLESIEPADQGSSTVLVQILITNIGSEPYLLPVARDGIEKLTSATQNFREFWCGLYATSQRYPEIMTSGMFASSELGNSTMAIPPRGTVRVRYKVDPSLGDWRWELGETIRVKAQCAEWPYQYKADHYYIHFPAPDAISQNDLIITKRR
jgi:hypothetical protein